MSVGIQSPSKFRFSLGELLGAIALVAVGLTWPLVLFFVVPLIITRIHTRMGYGSFVPVIATIVFSMALGVLFSFCYWHYPFKQPSTLPYLRNIDSVDQLSWISGLDSKGGSDPSTAITYFLPASKFHWNNAGELDGVDRILAEFENRNVVIRSTDPVSKDVLASLWNAANSAGLLISGEAGYPDTKLLRGYVGTARKSGGERFAFAALMGGQQSNDHYPYYEFVVPLERDKLTIESSQWFYVDISSLEGMNWLGLSVIAFLLMLPITIMLQMLWAFFQRRAERRSQVPAQAAAGTATLGV